MGAGTQLGLACNLTSTDILSDTVAYSHASCIPKVRVCKPTNAEQDLPVHLHALFEEAQSQLSPAEMIALKSLLLDVFAQMYLLSLIFTLVRLMLSNILLTQAIVLQLSRECVALLSTLGKRRMGI